MDWIFEQVAGPFGFTEGPTWDPNENVVYFSDIPSHRILRYYPENGRVDEWISHTNRGNGLALGPDRAIYCCEMGAHQVSRYAPNGSKTVVADSYRGERLNSPNDLFFDTDGRLWFSDPDYSDQTDAPLDHRSIYRIDDPQRESSLTRVTYDTTNPNGLLLSPSEETLYVAQSEFGEGNPRELRAYSVTEEGLDGYNVLHDFYPHRGIDGMCLDADGHIIAAAGSDESGPGPLLYVFTPSGRALETHPFPGEAPTNVCFGGPDLMDLYATGYGGSLYRIDTEWTGFSPQRS